MLNLTVLDPTDVEPTVTTDESGFERLTFTSSKAEGEVYTTRDIQMLRGSVIKPGTIKGLSPISAAREMLGANLGIQKYGAAFFGNSATPGAIIEVPGQLSPEGVAQMKGAWNDVHKGAANGHRLAVLTESAKWTQTLLSPEDASYIRGLEHGIQDVARLYGLPPFLLADTSRATSWGSGLHEMNVAMVQYSLRPLANKVSAAFTSIMRSEGIAVAYARFDVGAISRAGNERWETYSKGIQMGVYSIDEVRNLESMAPLPNGEGSRHYIPLNLAPVDGEGFPEE